MGMPDHLQPYSQLVHPKFIYSKIIEEELHSTIANMADVQKPAIQPVIFTVSRHWSKTEPDLTPGGSQIYAFKGP